MGNMGISHQVVVIFRLRNMLVRHLLEGFLAEDNANVAEVLLDSQHQALGIVFQTSGMRKMIEKFPQIILVDATYCTNASNYKLFSFMVTDAFGRGQFVQHAFVSNESKDVMVKVLKIFKQNNPASTETCVFMIDKDLKEDSALQEVFPNARVLLCHFHVRKWFNTKKSTWELDTTEQKELMLVIQR
jgi:zinc finger SWIM domain-containing protein 3